MWKEWFWTAIIIEMLWIPPNGCEDKMTFWKAIGTILPVRYLDYFHNSAISMGISYNLFLFFHMFSLPRKKKTQRGKACIYLSISKDFVNWWRGMPIQQHRSKSQLTKVTHNLLIVLSCQFALSLLLMTHILDSRWTNEAQFFLSRCCLPRIIWFFFPWFMACLIQQYHFSVFSKISLLLEYREWILFRHIQKSCRYSNFNKNKAGEQSWQWLATTRTIQG